MGRCSKRRGRGRVCLTSSSRPSQHTHNGRRHCPLTVSPPPPSSTKVSPIELSIPTSRDSTCLTSSKRSPRSPSTYYGEQHSSAFQGRSRYRPSNGRHQKARILSSLKCPLDPRTTPSRSTSSSPQASTTAHHPKARLCWSTSRRWLLPRILPRASAFLCLHGEEDGLDRDQRRLSHGSISSLPVGDRGWRRCAQCYPR